MLRIADSYDPSSLDPLLAHDQVTIGFDLLFAQTLVGLSADNRLVPVLTVRVPSRANGDVSPDGRTITHRLRHGIRFADGRTLTSADVGFTYAAIMDARNPVLSRDAYRRVTSLSTPDRWTVVMRLQRPWNAAVRELFAQSDFAFGILPAHAFTSTILQHAPWEEHAFGTGPFRVTQWRRGDRAVLEPNPYFSPRPKLTRIELRMIPDPVAAFDAVRAGDVDLSEITAGSVPEARSIANLRTVATAVNGMNYLAIQTEAAPANDIRVRQAIVDALDVNEIERTFHGLYPRAAAFLPPVLAWHDENVAPIAHDATRAAAELEAAGWTLEHGVRTKHGVRLEVLFVGTAGPLAQSESVAVQSELAAAGIRTTIKLSPATTFFAPEGPLRTGRFTISTQQWIGGADPEQSVEYACSQIGPDGVNVTHFCDPRFEAAFADQAVAPDDGRRKRDFLAMQRVVRERLPVIPLHYITHFDVMSPRVSGFARNMLEFPVGAENWDAK